MLPVAGKREKRRGDCQKRDELHPGPPADLLVQGDDGAAEAQKSRSKPSMSKDSNKYM